MPNWSFFTRDDDTLVAIPISVFGKRNQLYVKRVVVSDEDRVKILADMHKDMSEEKALKMRETTEEADHYYYRIGKFTCLKSISQTK